MKGTRRIKMHSTNIHSIIMYICIFIVMFMLTSCNCKKTEGHNHQLSHIDKVEATCTKTGVLEHYKCTSCGKYFSDKDGKNEIKDTKIASLGHIYDETSIRWEWSENNEKAVAILTCKVDETHKERINAPITIEETSDEMTYSATITYNNTKHIDQKTIPFSQELLYTLNEDGTSYSVTGIKNLNEKNIKIPSSYNQLPVTCIKEYAFSTSYYLTMIIIPNSVTCIKEDAFFFCDLKNVYYEGTIEDWCNITFSNYSSHPMQNAQRIYMKDINNTYQEVTEIKIPDTITSINNYQFYNFRNITSIEIPDSITSIGENAFSSCYGLSSITIPNSVTQIGENAFSYCSSLESIAVDANNPIYDSRENSNALIETSTNTLLCGCKNTIIPNGVTCIGSYAFSSCYGLGNITIPNSVTSIGDSAFSSCYGLSSITIPNSVTHIGDYAFYHCQFLYEITNHSDLVFELGSYSCGYIAYYAKRIIDKNGNKIENENSKLIITENNFVFLYEEGKYILKSYIGSESDITLPENINGCKYTISGFSILTTTSITIPNSVTHIGDYAFYYCSSLTSITIPNSVTSIGYYAFSSCSSLTNVYYDGTIEDWCNIQFYSAYINNNSNPMVHAKHFYMKDINNEYIEVTEIKIPDTITHIGDYQFYGFDNIKKIEIPNSVVSIGKEAFSHCSNLTSITISISETSIESDAFLYCESLTNVYYNGNIEAWCNIKFENSFSHPMSYAKHFYMKDINNEYKEVTELKIPDTITTLNDYQFLGFDNITSITFSEGVKDIGKWTFEDCSSLACLTIPSSIINFGWAAFSQCNSIASIVVDENNPFYDSRNDCNAVINTKTNTLVLGCKNTNIPYSVTCIGAGAFYGCSSLRSIDIPNRVTQIKEYAFYNCSSLTSIEIPSSVTHIGDYAFDTCSSINDLFYNGTIEDWCNITFDNYLSNPMNETKHFYIKHNYNKYTEVTEITIPDTIKNIGNYQFYGFDNLRSITLPNGVRNIGICAFQDCSSLINITIPNGVTCIEECAFRNCSSLTSIEIPNSVTIIEGWAFEDCNSLTNIILSNSLTCIEYHIFSGCSSLTSIVIPNSVTSIEENAFKNCISLTSITIPNSVTNIECYAFEDCMSLTSIPFENTTGWFITLKEYGTTGTTIDVTNDKTNATNLTSKYRSYYWKCS